MEVREVVNQQEWNKFVQSVSSPAQLTQSWEWGEFQKNIGWKVERLGVYENNQLIAGMQWYQLPLPFGFLYGYAPRGPIFVSKENIDMLAKEFFTSVQKTLGKKGVFLRCEPLHTIERLATHAPEHTVTAQPENEWVLNVTYNEEGLLQNMHPKTRYNIRLAEKKGVRVASIEKKYFGGVWKLLQETSKRGGYYLHTETYYEKLLEQQLARLVGAYYKDTLIAVTLLWSFGDTTAYLHGASSYEHRNIMSPYLLHWENIKKAKGDRKQWYNFGGVAPEDDTQNSWKGITRFKKGFGGKSKNYPGTYDYIFDKKKYWVYRMSRKLRRTLKAV